MPCICIVWFVCDYIIIMVEFLSGKGEVGYLKRWGGGLMYLLLVGWLWLWQLSYVWSVVFVWEAMWH